MIKDWNRQKLEIDYHNIKVPSGKPSDIDFVYVEPHYRGNFPRYAILAEIKNEIGEFTDFQRYLYSMYTELLEKAGVDVYTFYLNHHKYVEKGDTNVDASSDCIVKEVYDTKLHEWCKISETLTFQQALDKIIDKYK